MRYLVLADIHSNLEALDACLADAAARGYDRTLVLGDMVGYGPDPNAVVERVQALAPAALVRGNHDKIALGIAYADGFNAVARHAAQWTLRTLTPKHVAWLAALAKGPMVVDALIEICHGTPYDEDEYLFDELDAVRAMQAATRPLCLFGHTHQPAVFERRHAAVGARALDDVPGVLVLREDSSYVVNPGSVGQPRDGDSRAAYALVDVERKAVEMVRVPYAIADVQQKILAAGLPRPLAQRLGVGR